MKQNWKRWWKAAAIRAVKTLAQTAAATVGTAAVLSEVNWPADKRVIVPAGGKER